MDLSHIEHGTGSPVVILHGLYGSARNWNTIAKRLAAGYRVIALDLRNHGRSPWADSMDYFEMAGDVAEFIRRHGLQGTAILGHSLGGKVAMTLALRDGDLVGSLIVADIAPVSYDHGLESFLEALEGVSLEGMERRAEVDAGLAGSIPDPSIRAFLLQNLVRDGGGWGWRVNLACRPRQPGRDHGLPRNEGRLHRGRVVELHPAWKSSGASSPTPGGPPSPMPDISFIETVRDFLGGE